MVQKIKWSPVILLLALLASACAGGEAPAPKIADNCLLGTWQVTSDETFGRALIPPGAIDPKTLKYKEKDGTVTYTFKDDGTLAFQALPWKSRMDVAEGITLYELILLVEGSAAGDYSLEGETIRTGSLTQNEARFLATLDGEVMMDSDKAQEFLPLFVPPYTYARYTCSGDDLTLEITNLPGVYEPIVLERVR
jgi:hypothetical protein